jgi:hypothetical protein
MGLVSQTIGRTNLSGATNGLIIKTAGARDEVGVFQVELTDGGSMNNCFIEGRLINDNAKADWHTLGSTGYTSGVNGGGQTNFIIADIPILPYMRGRVTGANASDPVDIVAYIME